VDYLKIEKDIMRKYINPYMQLGGTTYSSIYGSWSKSVVDKWTKPLISKPTTFLTNIHKSKLDKRLPEYQEAAKKVGTEVKVVDKATTMFGDELENYVAIHILDTQKRSAWWGVIIKEIANEVSQELKSKQQQAIQISFPDFFKHHSEPTKKLCNCETVMLMRNGCQCGGV